MKEQQPKLSGVYDFRGTPFCCPKVGLGGKNSYTAVLKQNLNCHAYAVKGQHHMPIPVGYSAGQWWTGSRGKGRPALSKHLMCRPHSTTPARKPMRQGMGIEIQSSFYWAGEKIYEPEPAASTNVCRFNQPCRVPGAETRDGLKSPTNLKEIFHLLTKFTIPLNVFPQRSRPDKERAQFCLRVIQR